MSNFRHDAPMNLHRGDAQNADYLQGYADGIAAARGQATAPRRTDGAIGKEDAAKAEWAKNANRPFFEKEAQTSGPEKRGETPRKLSEEEAKAIERANINRPIWDRNKGGK